MRRFRKFVGGKGSNFGRVGLELCCWEWEDMMEVDIGSGEGWSVRLVDGSLATKATVSSFRY